jgi:hypothetical protein
MQITDPPVALLTYKTEYYTLRQGVEFEPSEHGEFTHTFPFFI